MKHRPNQLALTIVGLGLPQSGKLSPSILSHLEGKSNIYVKTCDKTILSQLPSHATVIEPAIGDQDGIGDGYTQLANDLLQDDHGIYVVPGDPNLDEASTAVIINLAQEQGVLVNIIPNQSILAWSLRKLNLSPGLGLQIIDATLLCSYHYPPLESHRSVLIIGLYHPNLIEPVQKVLGQIYHPQTVCQVLSAEQVRTCPLSDINETAIQVYIPEQPDDVGLTRFQETIAHLRAPDGCPWDKKQTHQTLRPYLLEETYEVLAAIDEGSAANMADELGDLLLQIVLHAQIAGEAGTFTMTDIVSHIQKKMIRRHPHVFANTSVNSVDDVKRNWDQIKAQEKAEKGELAETPSAMDGVLDALPALVQALDISKKAVKQGFEWDDAQGVLRKLQEEAEEIVTATSPAEIEAEIGDFLFTAVNLARKMGVDAETALRACNTRFMRRFRQLERIAEAQNLTLPEIDKKTWFALWQQAKKEVAHLEK